MAFQGECRDAAGMSGLHLTGANPFVCLRCGAVDREGQELLLAAREAKTLATARRAYQEEIKYVALSIFASLITKELVRDMAEVVRSSDSVKAARTMTDMMDAFIAGSIHFVTELSKLRPSDAYVEQHRATSSDPTLDVLLPTLPPGSS